MNKLFEIPKDYLEILRIFKQGRSKLVSDFIEHELMIFTPMFKYENDLLSMDLSIEKYFVSWINYHFVLFNEVANKDSKMYYEFLARMSCLLEKYIKQIEESQLLHQYEFVFQLLEGKLKHLHQILLLNDKSEKSYQQLINSIEKDTALFERQFKRLKEE
jgi:hypothetical protein